MSGLLLVDVALCAGLAVAAAAGVAWWLLRPGSRLALALDYAGSGR